MTKTMTIPFHKSLENRITSAPGMYKVVTKGGKDVRIVCWDRACEEFPIVALVDKEQHVFFYTPDGKRGLSDNLNDLMVEVDMTPGDRFHEGYDVGFNLAIQILNKEK